MKKDKTEDSLVLSAKVDGDVAKDINGLIDHMNKQFGGQFVSKHKLVQRWIREGVRNTARKYKYQLKNQESDNHI